MRNKSFVMASLVMIILKIANRFGASLYIVSLPAMALSLGIPSVVIRFSMSMFLVGAIISYVVVGILSHKYDTVKLLLGGLIIFTVGSFIIYENHSIVYIFLGRMLQGLGIGFAPALGNVLIAEAMPEKKQNKDKIITILIAYSSIVVSWAPAIGMIIGGYLQLLYGWKSNFMFLAIIGLFLTILLFFYKFKVKLPEQVKSRQSSPLKSYMFFIQNVEYMKMVLPFSIASGGITAYYLISSFVFAESFHLPPHYVAYLALFQVGAFLGGKLLSVFLFELCIDLQMLIAFLICIISGIVMDIATFEGHIGVAVIIVSIMGYSLGLGLIMPYISVKVMTLAPDKKTVGSTLFMLIILGMMAISAGIVSFFHVEHVGPLGYFLTVLALLALMTLAVYRNAGKRITNNE